MSRLRSICLFAVLMLVFAACTSAGGGGDTTTTTTAPPETTTVTTQPTTSTTEVPQDEFRALGAAAAAITVDGDGSDWADIAGLDVVLEPIEGKDFESRSATVKVAHDGEFLYVLYTVEDDYDYTEGDPHLSASPSVMWAVESSAGPHMGTDAEDGEGPSLGMVDIWHWELECGPGENQGGAVAGPGDGDPGNDSGCNFDDEWATDPETREDDNDASGENSLLGVFHHTSETNGDAGVWTFEMRRPLSTGDVGDAQFTVGGTGLLALAYWDADNSPEGWDDADHVQSSQDGWIEVTLAEGDVSARASRTLQAPQAAITVDGDGSDWADIAGLDVVLEPIEGKDFESRSATVKVAHDGEFLYVLYTVEDDYDYTEGDPHLSASPSVMWAVESSAGAHMGTDAEDGEGPSLGMVDIWHWELECGPGENQGGAVAGPGDGDLGNDSGCNFDDEWATDPETREDDNDASGENSLLGVFHHTSETNGDAGVWTFEMSRPLSTGDVGDAQFTVGGTGLLALAYWDADNSPEGWDDADHVQSSQDGWIEVALMRS